MNFQPIFFLRKILQHKETKQNKQKVTNKTKTSEYETTKAIIFRTEKLLRG